MKRVISGLLLVAMIAPAGSAFAQADAEPKSQLVTLEEDHFRGNRKAAAELVKAGKLRADFSRLTRVKKSFMPQVQESAAEPSLR
jgi:hypothetical protein